MPLPLALLGGAALGFAGNLVSGGAQKRGAQVQAEGFRRGQDMQMDMYREGQQATQPYRQAGTQALGQYQNLLTTHGQGDFFNEYQQSPIYQALQQEAEQTAMRNASATGGLRTGQSNVALASIAPQLAMQGLQQRLGGLQNLYSTGANAAGQTASLAPQVGGNIANMMGQEGAATGQGISAMGNAFGNTLGQLGGLGMYAAQGGFKGLA